VGRLMSPTRQPGGSSQRKIARQTSISTAFKTERKARRPHAAAKKRRDFDPHAFLATIGEGRKSVFSGRNKESLPKAIPLMRCFIFKQAK